MKSASAATLLGLMTTVGWISPGNAASTDTPRLLSMEITGIINPPVSDYVTEGIKAAEERKCSAVLIQLDTPGGLLDSTRSLIGAMLNTDLPVIVYVAPRGARATSAGVFITIAADVAAMAPETHIGAAHPVTIGESPSLPRPEDQSEKQKKTTDPKASGKDPSPASVMEEKMVSDASAYIRSLALERGRNADWAECAVRESLSLTAEEAQKQKVVDLVAPSRDDLLKAIHKRQIKKGQKTITLETAEILIQPFPMSPAKKFLHKLAHPNVAYILLMIGVYALIYELAAPGVGMGGIVGIICLLLAFFSLQILPVSTVGVVLIVAGLAALIIDLFTPTHGILTVGGLAALAVGSFMLVDTPGELPIPRVSLALIIPFVAATAGFFGFALRKALLARKARPKTGAESLIGRVIELKAPLTPAGSVFLNGEWWTARSTEPLSAGEKAVVTGIEGNILIVEKVR